MTAQASAAETSPGGDEERVLIEAAKLDPRRFAELYERNFDRVYAFVARRAGGRVEAEDLTAEVFHHALAHLGRFEWRGIPFAAWLLQIARNALAIGWSRRWRRWPPTRAARCLPPIRSWPHCSASPTTCAICPTRPSRRGLEPIS